MVKKFGLTNNQLKIIAMVSMLFDHIGKELLPQYPVLQIIGRLAFPIFAYMIAEGCFYTRNRLRYFLTIALMGIGCQTVFFVAEKSLYQNIFITFALSVALIFAIDFFRVKKEKRSGILLFSVISAVVLIAVLFPVFFRKQGFFIDYSIVGVLLPVTVFFTRDKLSRLGTTTAMLVILSWYFGGIQWFSLLSVPLLAFYNQKRGKYNIKPLFYIFYPTHLVVIYLISLVS